MEYADDFNHALETATRALARMKKDGIPPSPKYFELWYVYYASSLPSLKDKINMIVAERGSLSASDCAALHEEFLDDGRNNDLYQKAGDHIQNTIEDVSGLMSGMKTATHNYSNTLEGVSARLEKVSTKEEVASVLQDVVNDTNKMMEQNKTLEDHLERSSKIMIELKRELEQVRKEAMTDGLTGLTNRKSFDEKLEQTAKLCSEENKAFSLLLLDIDHFKSFNDNYGHQVGDQVLRLVAKTLIDSVKGRDTAARYGGEEFAIILPDTNVDAGRIVAENLRKAIERKEIMNRTTGENLGRITISIGVAQHHDGESLTSLIERADAALYTAKHNGRNQVANAGPPVQSSRRA